MDDLQIKNRLRQLSRRVTACIDNKKKEKTQAIQAKEMGYDTASNLSKYRLKDDPDAKITIMGADNLIRIADYYKVSTDYLLGFTDDKAPLRKDGDNLIREICDFTGLSREAIEVLHKRKNDFLYTFALSFLLTNGELLSNIIEYILTSLYDDVAADDRYNLLPGADKHSKDEGKPFFADTLELMPQYRETFHNAVIQTEEKNNRYVSEMAMRCIDKRLVFSLLYPYIMYDPTLSPDEAEKKNSEVRQDMDAINTDEEYEFRHHLRQRSEVSDVNEVMLLQDNQLEAFYKECFEYQFGKTS